MANATMQQLDGQTTMARSSYLAKVARVVETAASAHLACLAGEGTPSPRLCWSASQSRHKNCALGKFKTASFSPPAKRHLLRLGWAGLGESFPTLSRQMRICRERERTFIQDIFLKSLPHTTNEEEGPRTLGKMS